MSLHDLAREAVDVERIDKPANGWSDMQWETAAAADLTARTAKVLHQRILEKKLETIYSEMELPLAPLLYRMERAGLKVDAQRLSDLSNYLGQELKKLTVKIYELAGREFNIGSPKQVGEVLSELDMTSGRKTSTGRVSTSKAVLEELAQTYELPRLIIDYRELDKLKSVYTDALPHQIAADGRIHCLLNQTVAATGRLSSSDPNLQNIPIRTELGRRIRRAFVAEKGNKIISADYSQLELRLLAHITQDPVMLEAFQKGEDIHARTARLVFGAKTDEELKEARRFAKIVNFAIAYAIEPWGLSQRVGISRPGSEESDRGLLQHLQRRAPLHGRGAGAGARAWLRAFDLWSHSSAAGHQRSQCQHSQGRRARSDQHADSGNGQRHREDRDAES